MLEITEEQIEKMTVFPAHRHGLGKYWQVRTESSLISKTRGKKSAIFGTHDINFNTAREIIPCSLNVASVNPFDYVNDTLKQTHPPPPPFDRGSTPLQISIYI